LFAAAAVLVVQNASGQDPVLVNPQPEAWKKGPRDPEGAGSIVLREDAKSGALELLVRYPGGHVLAPHWHESNERIVLFEGRLALREEGGGERFLDKGGFAYLPARQVQRLVCVSREPCVFYVAWDGSPRSRPPSAK
jgi:quercetin dioxygenase-like cupin family protein